MESKALKMLAAIFLTWAVLTSISTAYFFNEYMKALDENMALKNELNKAKDTISSIQNVLRSLNSSLTNINESYQMLLRNYSELMKQFLEELNGGYVSIIIDFGNGTVKHWKFFVEYDSNNTAFDLLMATGLDIDYTEYQQYNDVFVNCIAGLCGTQTSETSGVYWMLYINGELSSKGAKQTVVYEGDAVEWVYKEVSWG